MTDREPSPAGATKLAGNPQSMVTATERGWPGHYIMGHRCVFHRNTLLECGDEKIIVSTVGHKLLNNDKEDEIAAGTYYETMAFQAKLEDGYLEADIEHEIVFESEWKIGKIDHFSDARANEMHEVVIRELSGKMMLRRKP